MISRFFSCGSALSQLKHSSSVIDAGLMATVVKFPIILIIGLVPHKYPQDPLPVFILDCFPFMDLRVWFWDSEPGSWRRSIDVLGETLALRQNMGVNIFNDKVLKGPGRKPYSWLWLRLLASLFSLALREIPITHRTTSSTVSKFFFISLSTSLTYPIH